MFSGLPAIFFYGNLPAIGYNLISRSLGPALTPDSAPIFGQNQQKSNYHEEAYFLPAFTVYIAIRSNRDGMVGQWPAYRFD